MKDNKVLKLILIWLLPFLLFCGAAYNAIRSAIIFFVEQGEIDRLDGFAYLVIAIMHGGMLIIALIPAVILTIVVIKKSKKGLQHKT